MKVHYLVFVKDRATMTTDSYSVVRYAEENGWRRVSKSEYDKVCNEMDKSIRAAKRTKRARKAEKA